MVYKNSSVPVNHPVECSTDREFVRVYLFCTAMFGEVNNEEYAASQVRYELDRYTGVRRRENRGDLDDAIKNLVRPDFAGDADELTRVMKFREYIEELAYVFELLKNVKIGVNKVVDPPEIVIDKTAVENKVCEFGKKLAFFRGSDSDTAQTMILNVIRENSQLQDFFASTALPHTHRDRIGNLRLELSDANLRKSLWDKLLLFYREKWTHQNKRHCLLLDLYDVLAPIRTADALSSNR